MTTNDDFSFIRFLKVVKTLYESSSFTQLGKTVRSALRKPGEPTIEEEDSMIDEADAPIKSLTVVEKEKTIKDPPSEQFAILKALAACTSPKSLPDCGDSVDRSSPKKSKDKTQILDATPGGPSSQSLLEQVMSCTMLGIDGEYSDEDTYHGRYGRSIGDDDTYGTDTVGYGTDTLGETTTYDSLTDDGYESNRRPRRSRARRNRGRAA